MDCAFRHGVPFRSRKIVSFHSLGVSFYARLCFCNFVTLLCENEHVPLFLPCNIKQQKILTHWLPHQTVHDPPLISGHSMEYFRASESPKINHMCSNNRHKIRFQDFLYLKFNKWTAKYYRNINKNNSTWCVWLVRIQEIIFFLCRVRNVKKTE